MLGENAGLRGGSSHGRASTRPGQRAFSGLAAILKWVLTGGTLAIRVLATGILLAVGLPILTMVLYVWGYPVTPVPRPIVILVDGLQLLIVAYAVVVGAQLVVYAAVAVVRFGRRVPRTVPATLETRAPSADVGAVPGSSSAGWAALREATLRLADMIWLQERRGRAEFGPAALAFIRDAVLLELEHRRRTAALERRAAELESWTAQDSVVASDRM